MKIKIAALVAVFVLAPVITLAEADMQAKEMSFDTQIRLLALKYGQDEALARRIIRCESRGDESALGLNFEASSTIPWSKDIGWWQLNDYFHRKDALKQGFDITDKWQNLEYGFILMKKSGTKPWSASAKCWG